MSWQTDERRQLLDEWNDTAVPQPAAMAPGLFAARVAAVPDAAAVVFGDAVVSYRELDGRAGRLAGFLAAAGAGPESVVGLCLPRGVQMLTAVLAVWKAGAAYLPVDPELPAERAGFMLADSRAVLVIGTGEVLDELPAGRIRMVDLDDPVVAAAVAGQAAAGPGVVPGGLQLAYVIYTSGSTGLPKGVAVSHGALANYVVWAARAYEMDAGGGAPLHCVAGFRPDGHQHDGAAGDRDGGDGQRGNGGPEGLAGLLRQGGGFGLVKVVPGHLPILAELLSQAHTAGRPGG